MEARPPISAVPSLVVPDSYLWGWGYRPSKPNDWPSHKPPWAPHLRAPSEVENEIRTQIERALAMGTKISYIDAHMGMTFRDELLPGLRKLEDEFFLAIAHTKLLAIQRASPNFPNQRPSGVRHALRAMLETLTPGTWMYVGHPALDTPELRAVDEDRGKYWAQRRDSMLQVWTEPTTRHLIEERGIELVAITDLFDYEACALR